MSPLSETALQIEDTRLSHSVKRPRVETPNITSSCHKQLPPAADLLSQDHNSLGIITASTYRTGYLMSPLTSHFKSFTCRPDHLRLQYIPDTSALARRHQGRKRQFPHIEGNFATRVYVQGRHILLISHAGCNQCLQHYEDTLPCSSLPATCLNTSISSGPVIAKVVAWAAICRHSNNICSSGMKPLHCSFNAKIHMSYLARIAGTHMQAGMTQYHLSLSRTVPIRFQQIDELILSLKSRLQDQAR